MNNILYIDKYDKIREIMNLYVREFNRFSS